MSISSEEGSVSQEEIIKELREWMKEKAPPKRKNSDYSGQEIGILYVLCGLSIFLNKLEKN